MRYVISDIHGCYEEYKQILEKIQFSEEDELYVLGDAMDRGSEPIKVILDMMMRPNIFYIIGNHDYMMLSVLRKIAVEITEINCDNLTVDDWLNYEDWRLNGGDVTLQKFSKLSREVQQDILEYLEEASVYEILKAGKKQFVLVHAGICDFNEKKDLDEYDFTDFLYWRADYEKRYYQNENIYMITGHTPTCEIREDKRFEVYQGNGHIAIDCGCVYGGNLAAYCIETGEIVYVKSQQNYSEDV